MKAILFAILALSLSACSSSADTTGGTTTKKDAGGDGAADTGASTTDTGSATDTGSSTTETGGGGDDACFSAGTNADCQKCCATNHMTAYNAFVSTLHTCGCKAGVCDTACASNFCASSPMNPDAACTTCLNNAQSMGCKSDLTACASADCADFFTCAQSCPM